jgi:hypothetical protein
MEKKVLLEINRISSLMGVNSILNEHILSRFIKVGISEATQQLIMQIDSSINLFKSGLINEQELKKAIDENIDTLKFYVDESQLTQIKKNVDNIITNNRHIHRIEAATVAIKKEINDLEEIMSKSKQDVNINIEQYKGVLNARKKRQLEQIYDSNGQRSFLDSTDSQIKSMDWEKIISNISTSYGFKKALLKTMKAYDDKYLSSLTDTELQSSMKKLLEGTFEVRYRLILDHVEKIPSFQKKYLNSNIVDDVIDPTPTSKISLTELEKEYQRILKKPEQKRTPSEQSFFDDYPTFKNSDNTSIVPESLSLKYKASKKSATVEFKLKTNLVGSLGPEWLQGLKTLIESGFGVRKTANEWFEEATTTTQIITDFLDKTTKNPDIEPNIESFKTEYGKLMAQLKNEMQLSVNGWDSASSFDFDGVWGKIKTQMRSSAGGDKTKLELVNDLIKKCETQNYGTGIMAGYPGYGGWKSIGDILEITKNNLKVSNGDTGWIDGVTTQLKKSFYEFKEVTKSTGYQDLWGSLKKRWKSIRKQKDPASIFISSFGNFLKFLFLDLSRATIRKFFTGTYANLELLITRITSRGISRTSKSRVPQLATRLMAVWFSLTLAEQFLGPINDTLDYLYRATAEVLGGTEYGKIIFTALGLPIDYTDKDIFTVLKESVLDGNDELSDFVEKGKVIDFSNFMMVVSSIFSNYKNVTTDKAETEVNKLNDEITQELENIDKVNSEKYEKAKKMAEDGNDGPLKDMQKKSAGDALEYIIRKNPRFIVSDWKRQFPELCSNFTNDNVDYIKKNLTFEPGLQPIIIKALVDSQNTTVNSKVKELYDKYKDNPAYIATEVAKVYQSAKAIAEKQVSENNGIVPLLKMPDGKRYALFSGTDGFAHYWDPPYDDMITALRQNKWEAKDGKVVLKTNDKEFNIVKKNLCELFK